MIWFQEQGLQLILMLDQECYTVKGMEYLLEFYSQMMILPHHWKVLKSIKYTRRREPTYDRIKNIQCLLYKIKNKKTVENHKRFEAT